LQEFIGLIITTPPKKAIGIIPYQHQKRPISFKYNGLEFNYFKKILKKPFPLLKRIGVLAIYGKLRVQLSRIDSVFGFIRLVDAAGLLPDRFVSFEVAWQRAGKSKTCSECACREHLVLINSLSNYVLCRSGATAGFEPLR
jgi:hypothetical protein